MKTLYLEFPETYREINWILEKFTRKNYFDVPDIVDKYIELIVWMEVNRRWYNVEMVHLRKWLHSEMAKYPVSSDYFSNNTIQLYIIESSELWSAVQRELPVTPNSPFLMWHVDKGLWKLITSGVKPYVS